MLKRETHQRFILPPSANRDVFSGNFALNPAGNANGKREQWGMRIVIAALCVGALSACGSGGAGSAPLSGVTVSTPGASPSSQPSQGPGSSYARPTFAITIPARAASANHPSFVSAGALSVSIQLTADSAGLAVASLLPNPAVTNVNGSSGVSCTSGCTISGPPSPPGTDSYTIAVYSGANASGSTLDSGTTTATIVEGQNNAETATLQGVPASLTLAGTSAWTANASNSTALSVTAKDALGNTITGTYATAVTVSDPDTNSDGSHVVSGSCPSPSTPSTSGNPPTSVTLTSSSSTATFCYLGLAESAVTLTASAPGATSATTTFAPTLNVPLSGTTTGAFVGDDAQLSATTGTGSTGDIYWSENGFTNAPYDQVLSVDTSASTCTTGGPYGTFASIAPVQTGAATVFIVSAASPYTPGLCTIPVWDGVTGSNAYTPPSFKASYTTSGFTVDGKHGGR
jgi:hypothetical protein